jgi:transposase
MKRFVEGEDRRQGVLLPEYLDDYVSEDNPVRVIEAFIDELDLAALGFDGVVPEATGRPGYHPGLLLKIYVYGYINQLASSRRLERESQRNVEMMWLTRRLAPDFKTIADFRKDNGPAIRAACRQFIVLCRRLELLTHAVAAIDGSKFKAANARDRNFTKAKLKKRLEQIEASIEHYMAALETADRQEGEVAQAKSMRLADKIAAMKEQMAAFKALEPVVEAAPDQQVSLTDPDARSMATSGRGSGDGRLQRTDRRRRQAPDRRPRGHQHRQRPGSTLQHGQPGQGRDGRGRARCAGRPRLLQGRRGVGLRAAGRDPLCA